MQKLEYELEQRSFSELAEKIKCARNRISYAISENFAWRTSPEKTSKMSVIGQKNNSPEKFLFRVSLVIENVLGWKSVICQNF